MAVFQRLNSAENKTRCLCHSLRVGTFITEQTVGKCLPSKTDCNQLQKYLRHCTVFWHKSPVHDLMLVIPPAPLIKVASNTRPCSKPRGTTLNGKEEGDQCD